MANSIKSDIDILEEIVSNELSEKINLAINNLPDKFKEPIILFYMEDKTYDEISEILRKPKNTIGTLISRAKIILKKELQKIYDRQA